MKRYTAHAKRDCQGYRDMSTAYWDEWRRRSAVPAARVGRTLLGEVPRLRSMLDTRLPPARMLDPLGVMVREAPGFAAPGACQSSENGHRIWLRKDDDIRRRRFTLCHELGHLLLKYAGQEDLLPVSAVERLCDEFASLLLIDRSGLAERLANGFQWAPSNVLALCREWKSNLTPMILALNGVIPEGGPVVLIASNRMNPRTGADAGYRIDAAAGGLLFLPRNQRLTSLGFVELASWSEGALPGKQAEGLDLAVRIAVLRRKEDGGSMLSGRACWKAAKLAHGILAVVDTSGMVRA